MPARSEIAAIDDARLEYCGCLVQRQARQTTGELQKRLSLSGMLIVSGHGFYGLKARINTDQITVVTISRMLRWSSRSSVMGEHIATSAASTGGMPSAMS